MTPWTRTHQVPLSMEVSRQEYWSGLPFPSPGNHSDPGIEPVSFVSAGKFFTTEPRIDASSKGNGGQKGLLAWET